MVEFSLHLTDNIIELHQDLVNKTYQHGSYQQYRINDPKPREIHKATVRDRLVHHAIYRILYPYFNKQFIFDSYSCRNEKGTHRAINRFRDFGYQVSRNHTRTAWVLKCDIRKFFASIDHTILKGILSKHIGDDDTLWLLAQVINSFYTSKRVDVGLPLGNLTSQLLANVYMNEFDQFIKRQLKINYYIRYADDFVILSDNREKLDFVLSRIENFLALELKLTPHPNKVRVNSFASGVDFLGWVHFVDHRVIRLVTKRRIIRRIAESQSNETLQSYFGILQHGNSKKIQAVMNEVLDFQVDSDWV